MELQLSSDETMLADLARDLSDDHFSFEQVRALRDAPLEAKAGRDVWAKMAELGLLGIDIDPEHGGLGLGLAALAIVQEQLGRTLALTPLFSTALLAGQALQRGGTSAQKAVWLPRIVKGEAVLSFAFQERDSRFDLVKITATASFSEGEYLIDGDKILVLDGPSADAFIISARDSRNGAVLLFLLSSETPGLTIEPYRLIDSRPAATLHLKRVRVTPDQLVAAPDKCLELLEDVMDRATVGLCAEMLGGMQQAFDMTVAYLREREQFGVKIGTFQALQHRAVRMFIALSMARPTVRAAALAAEKGGANFRKLVSQAKTLCSDGYILIANEAIQMHGGIGMTDDHPVGHYLKAARVAEMLMGDAQWHRARWASLHDY